MGGKRPRSGSPGSGRGAAGGGGPPAPGLGHRGLAGPGTENPRTGPYGPWLALAIILLVGAVMAGLWGGAWQALVDSQIFFPDRENAGSPGDLGLAFEDLRFASGDGVGLHGWWLPAARPRAVMLFCHGNAGNITHRLDNLARLVDTGISVLIFDYRGYGQSQGSAGEPGMYRDAAAALTLAADRAERAGLPLVVFGRSLGGVAAVQVAADPRVDGVILESTFTDLADMAARHFPLPGVGRAVKGRMDSLSRIGRVTAPKLFIHGRRDQIVPFALGRRLFEAAAEPKEFYEIPAAGHNDTYLAAGPGYFTRLGSFAAGLSRERN